MVTSSVIGPLGAALFYSPYVGLNWHTKLTCPLCPNVTVVGDTPLALFVSATIGGGILNAIFLFLLALAVWKARNIMKRLLFRPPPG